MSYTFTITCNTTEEIERLFAALRHDADPTVVEQVQAAAIDAAAHTKAGGTPATEEPANPPKRRGRPPRDKAPEPAAPVTDAANVTARDTGASEATATPAQQPAPLTIDDARGALRDLQSRIGEADMATALGVLSQFGANRISEVKAEDYTAFIDACKKAG